MRDIALPGFVSLISVMFVACSPSDGPSAGDKGSAALYRPIQPVKHTVPSAGIELGQGWNTLTSSPQFTSCIEFSPVQSTGQTVSVSMNEVSDQSEVMESVGVSASASVKTLFASGSAQASFASSSKVSASSTTLLLKATVSNGSLFVGPPREPRHARFSYPVGLDTKDPPPSLDWLKWEEATKQNPLSYSVTLTERAKELKSPAEFRVVCGDSFVAALYGGAQMLSTISFSSTTAQSKTDVKASMKAEFGVGSVSATGETRRDANVANTSLDISFFQVGGADGLIPISRDALQDKLNGLALEASRQPKFHTMDVVAYNQLPDWPFREQDDTKQSEHERNMEIAADFYWFLTSIDRDVTAAIQEPASFNFRTGLAIPELRDTQDQILELRRILYALLYANHSDSSVPPDAFSKLSKALVSLYADFGGDESECAIATLSASVIDNLAQCIRQKVANANPNVLRLNLPVPISTYETRIYSLPMEQYLYYVVDWHLGLQSRRICQIDPNDEECLEHSQLKALEAKVPQNKTEMPATAFLLQNMNNAECMELPGRKFVVGQANQPLRMASCESALTGKTGVFEKHDNRRFKLAGQASSPRCAYLTANAEQVHNLPCSNPRRQHWRFDAVAGQIVSEVGVCLVSAGHGGPVTSIRCKTDSIEQRWRVVPVSS